MLYLTLLTQCAILAAGVWAVFGGVVAGGLALITTAVLVVGALLSINSKFSARPGQTKGSCPLGLGKNGTCSHLEWAKDGGPLLGGLGIWYLFGLFAPLVVVMLFAPTISGVAVSWILLLYGVFSALYVYTTFPAAAFSSMWCLLSVGFGVMAWILGCFY